MLRRQRRIPTAGIPLLNRPFPHQKGRLKNMNDSMNDYTSDDYPEYEENSSAANLPLPPHSVEAEQSVLGGLLLENSAWDRIADVVAGEDFYRHEHRIIFRTITALINENRPADVITVQEFLERSDEIEAAGGFNYLISLAQNTPSAANIRRYAEIVRERAIMRRLAEVGTEIARNAYNPEGRDAAQLLDEAENKVFQIAESTAKSKQGFLQLPDLLQEVVERIDMLYATIPTK